MIKNLRRNLHSIGDLVFGSIINAKCKQNMVRIAVFKISRRFKFSAEMIENVQ